MVEALLKIKPELYRKYVILNNGKKFLYIKLRKVLYGLLNSGLLFWKDLSSLLIKNGFEVNPYNACVANKVIEGSQCTIVWYVDDLKISHKSKRVVHDVLKILEKKIWKTTHTNGTKV